jgi:hypothetical protein
MRVRVLVCAIAMLGMAPPASAGERPGYAAVPDALTLLLQDRVTTFGSTLAVIPNFDATPRLAASGEPLPTTLVRFEALIVPARNALPTMPDVEALAFTVATDAPAAPVFEPFDARRAIADVMADYPRPFRRRDILDTMVTLRFDGEPRTRTLAVGGAAGIVWGLMPRR